MCIRDRFQGVEGAYSQLAMKTYFGENCNGYNVDSWKAVSYTHLDVYKRQLWSLAVRGGRQ